MKTRNQIADATSTTSSIDNRLKQTTQSAPRMRNLQSDRQPKKVIYRLVPRDFFNPNRNTINPIIIEFFNAIKNQDSELVKSLLKKNRTLAHACPDAEQILGVATHLKIITPYQYAFLFGNLTISMSIFKCLGSEKALLQTQALGDVKDILEKIKDKDFPKLSANKR